MEVSLKDWPSFTDLERSFYEKHAYEQLLSYMANNNIGNYQEYFNDYKEVIKNYYQLCQKLEQEIVFPATNNKGAAWEVDFNEQCIKIRESAD